MAEWSKAVDLGSIPKGRGFKPHLLHFLSKGYCKLFLLLLKDYHCSMSFRVRLKAVSRAVLLKYGESWLLKAWLAPSYILKNMGCT